MAKAITTIYDMFIDGTPKVSVKCLFVPTGAETFSPFDGMGDFEFEATDTPTDIDTKIVNTAKSVFNGVTGLTLNNVDVIFQKNDKKIV